MRDVSGAPDNFFHTPIIEEFNVKFQAILLNYTPVSCIIIVILDNIIPFERRTSKPAV